MVPRSNLAENDVVLVISPNTPRGHWPLGRVIQVMPGSDGVERRVLMKTGTGEYIRPVAKLCILEKDDFDSSEPKPPPAVVND